MLDLHYEKRASKGIGCLGVPPASWTSPGTTPSAHDREGLLLPHLPRRRSLWRTSQAFGYKHRAAGQNIARRSVSSGSPDNVFENRTGGTGRNANYPQRELLRDGDGGRQG